MGVDGRMKNNAQACTNSKRFIIHEQVYDEFKEKVISLLDSFKVGDPSSEDTTLGPLAKESSVITLRNQVKDCLQKGGKIGYGDQDQLDRDIDPSKGFFFTPIILEDIPEDSVAFSEELFGPVFTFFKVKDDQEAIAVANSSKYGLGGAVHTTDLERGRKIALQVESGMVHVNGNSSKQGYCPFGGVKYSGYGREGGKEGCRQFVNIKTISITK